MTERALLCLLMIFSAHHAVLAFQKQRSSLARAISHADSPGNTKRRFEGKTKAPQHARVSSSLSHSFKYRQRRVSRTGSKWLGRGSQRQWSVRARTLGQ